VENLAHTLAGAVLARAGLDRLTPLAMPALLVAANLPDADVLGSLAGANYLDFHRGITHSLAGVAVLGLGWAALVWLWGRHAGSPERPVRFVPLAAVAVIGTLSHPLLDFLNDYGVRPWLPFSAARHYGDLVAIVDPWFWVILGTGAALPARSRRAKVLWCALGALLASAIALHAGIELAAGWVLGAAAALAGGAALERRGIRPAAAALAVFALYLAGTGGERAWVRASAAARGIPRVDERVLGVEVLPRIAGGPARWRVLFRSPSALYVADAGLRAWSRGVPPLERFEQNLDDPCYRAALSEPGMAAMSRFARFPFVETRSSPSGCTVLLRDLRYTRRSAAGFGVAVATVPPGPAPTGSGR
jgi:inner membrane protein